MKRLVLPWAGLVPWYGGGVLVAIGLKWFGSTAGADSLNWILAPTAWLASLASGIEFERELRAGWISHEHRMIVGSSCAGLNFMIVAFSSFFFTFVHVLRGAARRWGWLLASLTGAYILAVATNAVRILTAIHLFRSDIYNQLITPERIHRIAGIVIYCVSLLLAFLALDRLLASRARSALVPLGWYVGLVIGVPLLNRAYVPEPRLFVEHAVIVLIICALLAAAVRYLPRYRTR